MNWVKLKTPPREKRWRLDGGTEWELSESHGLFTIIENPERIGWGRNVRWIERTKGKAEEFLSQHLQLVAEQANLNASSQGVET